MKTINLLLITVIVAGCGPSQPEEAGSTTVAVMAEVPSGVRLDSLLHMLDQHLVNAMSGRMEGEAVQEFRRAEALTDRLLEARMPFDWLTAEQYSVTSRVRQIQSTADRVLAQVRTGAPRDQMLLDLRALRTDVVELREAIARGGSRSPTPISRLLEGDSAGPEMEALRQAEPDGAAPPPASGGGGGPLGTPVDPDGD